MTASQNPLKRIFHATRRVAANIWLNQFHHNTTQIGITGSYGKTSTTHVLYAVLSRHTPTVRTDINLDTIYNVPITALQLRGQKLIIFELGIDSPNEMAFHLEIARPEIVVMTGISPVHSDEKHLGSLENLIKEKRRLIEALPADGVAILNADNPFVREMASHTRASTLWYGSDPVLSPENNQKTDYYPTDVEISLKGTRFMLNTPVGKFPVSTPMLGTHSTINMLAATAVADLVGVPHETVQAAFASLKPLQGRMNVEPGPLGTTLVNDSLRANPASTRAGLAFLGEIMTEGQKIAVLGEMGELGDHAVKEHTEIGNSAAKAGLDTLICVGSLTWHTAEQAVTAGMDANKVFAVPDAHGAAEILRVRCQPEDVVYLKGSLLRHMERILLLLEGESVGCRVVSCPFYHPCTACQYRENGYNPN